MVSLVFFNLLVNSIFSLLIGVIMVHLFIWIFRVEAGLLKIFLLSLPMIKVIYDLTQGLPASSVLFSHLDPFSLPPRHQVLRIGTGFTFWGPTFQAQFSVKDPHGAEYSSSIGDYLVLWIQKLFGPEVPAFMVILSFGVTVFLLIRRVIAGVYFEKQRVKDRAQSRNLKCVTVGSRIVRIYLSQGISGSPFTGGLIKPYICIPMSSYAILNTVEREAVIAHELAHVRRFDIVSSFLIQVMGDIFWFVPGYRLLIRKLDRLREIVADRTAVDSGAHPVHLAHALVKLKAMPDTSLPFAVYSAFFRDKSVLRDRIQRLLGEAVDMPPRFGWQKVWIRIPLSAWILTSIMLAGLGGNHQAVKLENPQWFKSLLREIGVGE